MNDDRTISDVWPGLPDADKLKLAIGMHDVLAEAMERTGENEPWQAYWQIDSSSHGVVERVTRNFYANGQMELWSFARTLDSKGHQVIRITRAMHLAGGRTMDIGTWDAAASMPREALIAVMAKHVGMRCAKGVMRRLEGLGDH